MIRNIIFDFGDVFINLDKEVVVREALRWGGSGITPELRILNERYEIGGIETDEFIAGLQAMYPQASAKKIIQIWNAMLLDFPEERLLFLERLSGDSAYRLFLLSNTNALHIPHVEMVMGTERFQRFRTSFEGFYLSHEIGMRKPNAEIFQFVLDRHGLDPMETLFIDDSKENTDAADKLGIRTWNLQVGQDDVTDLKNRLPHA